MGLSLRAIPKKSEDDPERTLFEIVIDGQMIWDNTGNFLVAVTGIDTNGVFAYSELHSTADHQPELRITYSDEYEVLQKYGDGGCVVCEDHNPDRWVDLPQFLSKRFGDHKNDVSYVFKYVRVVGSDMCDNKKKQRLVFDNNKCVVLYRVDSVHAHVMTGSGTYIQLMNRVREARDELLKYPIALSAIGYCRDAGTVFSEEHTINALCSLQSGALAFTFIPGTPPVDYKDVPMKEPCVTHDIFKLGGSWPHVLSGVPLFHVISSLDEYGKINSARSSTFLLHYPEDVLTSDDRTNKRRPVVDPNPEQWDLYDNQKWLFVGSTRGDEILYRIQIRRVVGPSAKRRCGCDDCVCTNHVTMIHYDMYGFPMLYKIGKAFAFVRKGTISHEIFKGDRW
jgi:hypothetical protein